MIVLGTYTGRLPISSYRGYDFIPLNGSTDVLISHKGEPIDSASNIQAAKDLIDTWLNAP